MYVIEITEDKIDNVAEHIGKSLKYMNKAMECLEEMKETSSHIENDEDYDDMSEVYHEKNKYRTRDDEEMRPRYRSGGRYGR